MQVRFRRCAAGVSAGALLIGAFTVGTASASAADPDATADRFLNQAGSFALGHSSVMVETARKHRETEQKERQAAAEAAQQRRQAQEKERRVERILEKAAAEEGTTETGGSDCQPYSPQCVSWCALFAMWTWEEAGVDVDNEDYAFTGNVYNTGLEKGTAYDAGSLDQAKPGDVLLFGTSPDSVDTSTHIGVVEKVEGDTVTTIEGNAGDNADRVQRNQHPLSPDIFYGGVHPW